MDLQLISIDELVREIESRCSEFVCAFNPNEFQTKKESIYLYGKGSWHRSCALTAVLHNDVVNNWNGELKKLQRLPDVE